MPVDQREKDDPAVFTDRTEETGLTLLLISRVILSNQSGARDFSEPSRSAIGHTWLNKHPNRCLGPPSVIGRLETAHGFTCWFRVVTTISLPDFVAAHVGHIFGRLAYHFREGHEECLPVAKTRR